MGGPPGKLGGVVRPSRKARRGRQALQESQEGSLGPLRVPGVGGRPFWRAGRVWEDLFEGL